MLFSQQDITVLKLLCWCQYIDPKDLNGLATNTELRNLACLGLIKRHEKSGALILTSGGTSFLQTLFAGDIPKLSHSYHASIIQRRLRVSKVALTAYRAGVDIFTTTPDRSSASPTLFLSALTRSRGSNPWGSTRVAALAHLGDLVCAFHYVCPGIGKLALTDELTAFTNQTGQFRTARRTLVFAGESYQSILAELEECRPWTDTKLLYYGDAYRCVQLPVHLLSCDDTGVVQLQIMAVPDYRRRLTIAALKAQYQPPPKEMPAWDALFRGTPFVMAADMDLRRIDAALKTAQEKGIASIALACLEGQAETVLFSRYRDSGKARVFVLTEEALTQALGGSPGPLFPARAPYLTEKGDVIDAPPIQTDRKTGGYGIP